MVCTLFSFVKYVKLIYSTVQSVQLTTDQGLLAGTMLAQQEVGDSSTVARTGGLGPVTTAELAKELTTNRLANLVAKKLDTCLICKERHYYEKTWPKVTPPLKSRMISTHLSTCPKFGALSSEDKLRKVTAQGACLHCSAWDHNRHRGVGGATAGEPKCCYKVGSGECGAKHGIWYHGTANSTANTGSVVESCGPNCSTGL